jgi:hypothetical protein
MLWINNDEKGMSLVCNPRRIAQASEWLGHSGTYPSDSQGGSNADRWDPFRISAP